MVKRAVVIAMVLTSLQVHAEPPPTTWLDSSFLVGTLGGSRGTDDGWRAVGIGMRLSRVFRGHLELGGELQVLKVDAADETDPRMGLAFRGVALVGYRFTQRLFVDWTFKPEIGVSSSVAFGLGDGNRVFDEVFGGVELSVHVTDRGHALGNSHAWGSHYELRIGRSQGEQSVTLLMGHDWGL